MIEIANRPQMKNKNENKDESHINNNNDKNEIILSTLTAPLSMFGNDGDGNNIKYLELGYIEDVLWHSKWDQHGLSWDISN